MTRRDFVGKVVLGSAAVLSGAAGGSGREINFEPEKHIILAPEGPTQWPEFRRLLHQWRDDARLRLEYSDALYRQAEFEWAKRNFCCCFLMLCDETFYNRKTGHYRVDAFLEEGRRRFGGYDGVVLWHAYPRIGLDARNQFDFYRDMPGGLEGLRKAVDALHGHGVRAFIDYNPWDTGTRREPNSDLDALCVLVQSLAADGIFLDTMDRGTAEFRAKLDRVRPGVILEGEGALPIERIGDHHASWAQHFDDSQAPGVLRNKWFERRHMQHQIRRWDYDHTSELHAAWMNGSGMMVWENVFGSWVGWSERDRAILRSVLPIQRHFADLFCGESWTPLVPTLESDLYASLWQTDGVRLWTVVNRAQRSISGELIRIDLEPSEQLYDLISGIEVRKAGALVPPRGVACFLAARGKALGRGFSALLRSQRRQFARASFSTAHPKRVTRMVTPERSRRHKTVPKGMLEIGPANITLTIQMRNRECGFYNSNPPPNHNFWGSYNFSLQSFQRAVVFRRFAVDLTPVTNAQFAEYLTASKYRPRHPENFLKHWQNGGPPPGKEDHPVVYVDLDDARAYARWAGKRLPTEEEWQYAAQGADGRLYPWGNEMLSDRCNSGETADTTPVTRYAQGRSPFDLYDMCGNVWHWTESEGTDGRTRFCIGAARSIPRRAPGGTWMAGRGR